MAVDQRRYYADGRGIVDRRIGWNVAAATSTRLAKLIANALNVYRVRRSKPAEKRS